MVAEKCRESERKIELVVNFSDLESIFYFSSAFSATKLFSSCPDYPKCLKFYQEKCFKELKVEATYHLDSSNPHFQAKTAKRSQPRRKPCPSIRPFNEDLNISVHHPKREVHSCAHEALNFKQFPRWTRRRGKREKKRSRGMVNWWGKSNEQKEGDEAVKTKEEGVMGRGGC